MANKALAEEQADLESLIRAIARGDERAFESLYDATSSRIYGLSLHITGSPEDAEEVACDVYAQAWREAANFTPDLGSVRAWLMMICRSRAIDKLRRNKVGPRMELTDSGVMPEDDQEYPQDLLTALEERSAVHEALKLLDGRQRQLLALAYFRGYSHRELAGFTGIPLGSIKSLLRRGVEALHRHLSQLDTRDSHVNGETG